MGRRTGILFIFGAAIPLAIFASTAWACGVLATLKAAPSSAAAGQTVSTTGVNYSSSMTTFTPVSIRWDSRTGEVLKEVVPEQNGTLNTTVQIPASASAGDHILIATQNRIDNGAPKSGTPGRTVVRVPGTAGSASVPASAWSDAKPGGSGVTVEARESGYSPFLAIGLSLGLLTVGLALVGRDRTGRGSRREPLGA